MKLTLLIAVIISMASCSFSVEKKTDGNKDWEKLDTPALLPYLYKFHDRESGNLVYMNTMGHMFVVKDSQK